MSLTTDRNHPKLTHGGDTKPVEQAEVYLILSEEERAKGFVRPVRRTYVHVGLTPRYPLRDLTEEEQERYSRYEYVKYEQYPEGGDTVGRYWTQAQLDTRGCLTVTTMAEALAETYARDPSFYGATYCCGCRMHLPVEEFVWVPQDGDPQEYRVGS